MWQPPRRRRDDTPGADGKKARPPAFLAGYHWLCLLCETACRHDLSFAPRCALCCLVATKSCKVRLNQRSRPCTHKRTQRELCRVEALHRHSGRIPFRRKDSRPGQFGRRIVATRACRRECKLVCQNASADTVRAANNGEGASNSQKVAERRCCRRRFAQSTCEVAEEGTPAHQPSSNG
jgi:hypothetical protein